jgi:DNA primase
MDNDNAESLKRTIDIADLIERSGLTIVGSGNILTTKEHSSLRIWRNTNSYSWFSQGHGGSIFDWVMHTDNVDFPEAARRLEDGDYRSTVQVPPTPPKPVPVLLQDLHLRYNQALDTQARQWWYEQGITDDGIARFFLGVCNFHPYWRQTTYTIPVIEGGKLLNVRHRLSAPPKPNDKYRPETAGIPASLFNADILTPDLGGVVIVAGEKKAIVLWQYGIPAISSTAGCGVWKPEWTTRLQFCQKVYLAYDPGESTAAWKIATQIGERAFVVALPDKPDDFILAQDAETFRTHLRAAIPVADRSYWQRQFPKGRPMWGKLLE